MTLTSCPLLIASSLRSTSALFCSRVHPALPSRRIPMRACQRRRVNLARLGDGPVQSSGQLEEPLAATGAHVQDRPPLPKQCGSIRVRARRRLAHDPTRYIREVPATGNNRLYSSRQGSTALAVPCDRSRAGSGRSRSSRIEAGGKSDQVERAPGPAARGSLARPAGPLLPGATPPSWSPR